MRFPVKCLYCIEKEYIMKIIDVKWFTEGFSNRAIGIVLVLDEVTGEHKAYLGTGDGLDEDADAKHISEWGAKVHISQLDDVLDWMLRINHERT